ncbi:MAG TPA: TrkA family potassium uptake protein [Candidatus Merdenecus merdavium]|nr:TrkA family potassium uptake protein [Candidatus Merdenecus merdavium]
MARYKSIIEFGVIGLGRFGYALAKTLSEAGREVLVLDQNESKIKQIQSYTENAFVVEQLNKETLEEAGIQNCETVIICIAEKIDASILTTLNVINMGVPRVIAKAFSYEQGLVLEKLGAEVIYPESDMAVRLANRLTTSKALDFINLDDDITISELSITSLYDGVTILHANIRKHYNLNVIAIERDGKTTIDVEPNTVLRKDDVIVVIGKKDHVINFERRLLEKH